ncbi:MAG TPA: hypothetical protein VG602_03060 [Actinomycetota bacterium]|nr:hypothetical protein [Actinomycetota bacterium]
MVRPLRRNAKILVASLVTVVYVALMIGLAIAHHRPGHDPTPTACVVSQGKAPEKNPHCVSPSPSPTFED